MEKSLNMSHERILTPSEQGRAQRIERALKIVQECRDYFRTQTMESIDTPEGQRQFIRSVAALGVVMRAYEDQLSEAPVLGRYREVTSRSDGRKFREKRVERILSRLEKIWAAKSAATTRKAHALGRSRFKK